MQCDLAEPAPPHSIGHNPRLLQLPAKEALTTKNKIKKEIADHIKKLQ
jgi:hypothetical protein